MIVFIFLPRFNLDQCLVYQKSIFPTPFLTDANALCFSFDDAIRYVGVPERWYSKRNVSFIFFSFLFISSKVLIIQRISTPLYPRRTTCILSHTLKPGYSFLRNPWINKGSTFTDHERNQLGLRGLLPSGESESLDTKREIAMQQLRRKETVIDQCIYLLTIHDSDETLFYSMLNTYPVETLPLLDSAITGSVCQQWSQLYRQRYTPRGLYISIKDSDIIWTMLRNYSNKNIKVIVLTDGENIPGFGDLGANAMGIAIGKLALYTACAGIHPEQVLPVMIDVGTNTDSILNDPPYIGIRQKRD
jgi:hypothetical protein